MVLRFVFLAKDFVYKGSVDAVHDKLADVATTFTMFCIYLK